MISGNNRLNIPLALHKAGLLALIAFIIQLVDPIASKGLV